MATRKVNTRNIFMITIKPFNTVHQKAIDIMTLEISNEFETPNAKTPAVRNILMNNHFMFRFKV